MPSIIDSISEKVLVFSLNQFRVVFVICSLINISVECQSDQNRSSSISMRFGGALKSLRRWKITMCDCTHEMGQRKGTKRKLVGVYKFGDT